MGRKKKTITVFFLIFGFLLPAGCSDDKNENQKEYRAVVDDYAEILLKMDQDSSKYDHALESVGKYLEHPEPGALKDARKVLNDAVRQLEEEKNTASGYKMDDEFQKQLSKFGIDAEEYLDYADSRNYGLEEYIGYIQFLDQFLVYEEGNNMSCEELEFQYKNMLESQRVMRECSYAEINYWFAGQNKEIVDYVKENVLERLESYHTETPVWDDDREAVERRINVLLDEYEELVEEQARHIGEVSEELYNEEEN